MWDRQVSDRHVNYYVSNGSFEHRSTTICRVSGLSAGLPTMQQRRFENEATMWSHDGGCNSPHVERSAKNRLGWHINAHWSKVVSIYSLHSTITVKWTFPCFGFYPTASIILAQSSPTASHTVTCVSSEVSLEVHSWRLHVKKPIYSFSIWNLFQYPHKTCKGSESVVRA